MSGAVATVVEECDSESMTVDRLYHLLSHPYRRAVLAVLVRENQPVTLATLAKEIATTGSEESELPSPEDHCGIRLRLYHVHVPKLAGVGLVEFDPETTNTVALREDGPDPATVKSLLLNLEDQK